MMPGSGRADLVVVVSLGDLMKFSNLYLYDHLTKYHQRSTGMIKDYMVPSQYQNERKLPPPEPWPLPHRKSLNDVKMEDYGAQNLPPEVDNSSPLAPFDFL
jgi:hypothetical protein